MVYVDISQLSIYQTDINILHHQFIIHYYSIMLNTKTYDKP